MTDDNTYREAMRRYNAHRMHAYLNNIIPSISHDKKLMAKHEQYKKSLPYQRYLAYKAENEHEFTEPYELKLSYGE